MTKLLLNKEEQGIVVFKLWKSLSYKKRILLSSGLILLGLAMQIYTWNFLPGILMVFLGNLFLLPSGYNNNVTIGKYDPNANWHEVQSHKLDEFAEMEKKVKKWDTSTLDISNAAGFFIFLFILFVLGVCLFFYLLENNQTMGIISLNGAVLLLPYWVTGLRSIFTMPTVSRKIKEIRQLMDNETVKESLKGHNVDYYFLMGGNKDIKLPSDVKFRVNIANRHKDFLGLYGQIVINHVQSAPYPYFYMVLVAKKGFGLQEVNNQYQHDAKKVVKQFKEQDDVEILVIRQNTLIPIGYYTKPKQILYLFEEGLKLAAKWAGKGNLPG